MPVLGVNIDHVATLRQARGGKTPDPAEAAAAAVRGGAKWITAHLREDRRHIQDSDLPLLREAIGAIPFNLEMARTPEMMKIAFELHPDQVTIVPEKRKELTTEGGLRVAKDRAGLKKAALELKAEGIAVSFFVDPDEDEIRAARDAGADFVEIHTGKYANASTRHEQEHELVRLVASVQTAAELGLKVNAGHGLNYLNIVPVAKIGRLEQIHIGHSIVAQSVFDGIEEAVREMARLIG